MKLVPAIAAMGGLLWLFPPPFPTLSGTPLLLGTPLVLLEDPPPPPPVVEVIFTLENAWWLVRLQTSKIHISHKTIDLTNIWVRWIDNLDLEFMVSEHEVVFGV